MKKRQKIKKVTLNTVNKKIDTLITTVDSLATATKRGFDNTVSKEEFGEFKEEMTDFKQKTESALFNIDSKLQTVDQRLDAIEKTLGPLVHVSDALQRELREHERRISLVEHKVGLTNK